LTVSNLTDQPVILQNTMYRIYVYGKEGEAPTKLMQRQLTDRLRPGDAPPNYTLNVDSSIIAWPAGGATDWFDRKFQLGYLYDLSAPGRYTAFRGCYGPVLPSMAAYQNGGLRDDGAHPISSHRSRGSLTLALAYANADVLE